MSCLCIGGVCIPYSAILPFLLVFLRAIVRPLAKLGLIPEPIAKRLGIAVSTKNEESCCKDGNTCDRVEATSSSISEKPRPSNSSNPKKTEPYSTVDSMTQFQNLLSNYEFVIVKFTADWCGPCKRIHPLFLALAEKNLENDRVMFVSVDVDDAEDIAGQCEVKAMPTFQCYKEGKKFKEFSGASDEKLEAMVESVW
eukprot:CAMPEP_0194078876 /NCGR_PEP_ID=MMETSP0149-20130528/5172_1 /TAXON_ID=122233 /ORGANISM="Chaetoceros debilis, Strain MM31A-1" /LENGTH=196 /DNA_ID=CAMNT_0038760211 /DNA_START=118 /DNA_END=705 /DNA_ORIENTATION=+